MNESIINRKKVRKNKSMRRAQKNAKKQFGKVRGMWAPKAKINKVVMLGSENLFSLVPEENTKPGIVPDEIRLSDLLEKIHQSNLKGLSGNGFSTVDKLEMLDDSKAEKKFLIVNGVECDPGLVHDSWLLKNRFDLVKQGILVLQHVFSFEKIMIATKENINLAGSPFPIIKVPNKYPMGHEKMLIRTLLGKELTKQEIPAGQGILVMNLQTVLMLGGIICQGKSFTQRYVTVADLSCGRAEVALVALGTDAEEVIRTILPDGNGQKIYIGGGAMDCHEMCSGEMVDATTNFIAYGEKPDYESATACKGCGGCTSKCPMGIPVSKIVKMDEKGDRSGLAELHPENCIGCSACTYVCHAGKNIKKIMAKVNGK